jgi:adenosylhomocysteine nucleosidase
MNQRMVLSCIAAALVAGCRSGSFQGSTRVDPAHPIVVQGAMDSEVRALIASLDHPSQDHDQGWTFWRGSVGGTPIVVSKTMKGTANAAAATALAVERYHPIAIVNQGTAGGHDPSLHVADIVLGAEAVNIGAFKTGSRDRGNGSDLRQWLPLDLLQSDGSAGENPDAWKMRRFAADPDLLAAAERVKDRYSEGRVVEGVIGSSDMWNSELDRVQRFHDEFGTSAEEMETAAAAQVAGLSHTPFLGIRVLSNNITNGDPYNGRTAELSQRFVIEVVREYARQKAR